ncbi:hypothetical protein NSK_006411 [Nannochloropsis salina CCMP1776]|uniref:t-SNARE coiled-coil homology domain-containing protein n=1 Tax=Nannochloropsis salina CCMP1776 TaxID=1027361 RepID=A0A4D9CSU3_9STRA|nr:hypothetical protein NSK_006411 [Nannochloropsis salina CCMP1776]|eukprot:TFJ82291.1 hypothetical protein NSK_006411 [Nannochloropsis salina CCMP1776]
MEPREGPGDPRGSHRAGMGQQKVSFFQSLIRHLVLDLADCCPPNGAQERHQFKSKDELDAYLRVAHESVAIGRETLTAVAGQQEALDRSEAVVDSNLYVIKKSARTLRGMTWWGSLRNYFSEEPEAPRPRTPTWLADRRAGLRGPGQQAGERTEAHSSDAPLWRDQPRDGCSNPVKDERQELFARRVNGETADARLKRAHVAGQGPQSLSEVARMQDDYLESLGKSLDEQRGIGGTLHEALREQRVQVDRLEAGSEGLEDATRAVIRKAARASRARGGWGAERPRLYKFVAFREVRSGLFISVAGEELRLQEPHMSKACQFAAYTSQTLTGLQSVLSRKWLGQHWISGALGVRGTGLGKNEEWEVDWRRPEGAFLLSCSANWGSGGYLMAFPKKEETLGQTLAYDLRLGGYNGEERGKAALFEIVDCENYRTTDVVTEIIQKKTPAELAAEEERKRKGSLISLGALRIG